MDAGFTVRRGTLPPGDLGTRKTLQYMSQLAIEGASLPEVREAAIRIIRQSGVRSHDLLGALRALFGFVRDRVTFVRDPVGVELIGGPRYTLRTMAGDCDDRATLLVSLIRALGIPAKLRFRVIAADPRRRSFSHVYVIANVQGRDIPLDPTYPQNQMGWQLTGGRIGDFAT